MPAHHFLVSLTLAGCVWFGIGVAALVSEIAKRFRPQARRLFAVGVAAVMVAAALPSWRDRGDLQAARATSQYIESEFDRLAVSTWIAQYTADDAIVVYAIDGDPGLIANALDQRVTLAVDNPYFSNPYLDWQQRYGEAQAMIEDVRRCDSDALAAWADRDVGYLVVAADDPLASPGQGCGAAESVHVDRFATVLAFTADGSAHTSAQPALRYGGPFQPNVMECPTGQRAPSIADIGTPSAVRRSSYSTKSSQFWSAFALPFWLRHRPDDHCSLSDS